MSDVKNTIKLLKETFPKSRFNIVKEEWIKNIETQYSELPSNLKNLYNKLGYGDIENGYYFIHVLMDPDEIYDSETAKELKGKLIVGADSAGDCHAYDTEDNWSFGMIGCNGKFEKLDEFYADFIDYLNQLCLNQTENE